nr:MAG TPA: hypothetical protein [Caudoviricetes sp.]
MFGADLRIIFFYSVYILSYILYIYSFLYIVCGVFRHIFVK